jgi:hypothetical protein
MLDLAFSASNATKTYQHIYDGANAHYDEGDTGDVQGRRNVR